MDERIYLYDSTLRDGAQARGVDFTLADKIAIAEALDALGIDFIEGGWPGANPADDAFFAAPPKLERAQLTAFGMTRRAGRSASNDPGLQAVLSAGARDVCLVGKAWARQVETALHVSRRENLAMIRESIAHARHKKRRVHFDAEHFFDGYAQDAGYALATLEAALEGGAQWLILCDTNGGSLPSQIYRATSAVRARFPQAQLGIHCHNDTEQAVANSLAAVEAGVRQVQGTINGIGERCGNANLCTILPTLMLKMGLSTGVSEARLTRLCAVSRLVDERLNRAPNRHAAYVGASAFAHKGGLHVSAMGKDSTSYEHIDPAKVGNARLILISDKAGKANILSRLAQLGIPVDAEAPQVSELVRAVKSREALGYAYEDAEASFVLMARAHLEALPPYFALHSFRALDEQRQDSKGRTQTLSEATVKLQVGGELRMTVAEGNGPVNALDAAMRKALLPSYPRLADMHLADFKVRILTPADATAALTRVMIESRDARGESWTTIGVSHNIIEAAYHALSDAITYFLLARKVKPR